MIALNSLFGVWAGGQNIIFSVPSTELVLRSIGGREGEKGRGKGSGLRLSPRTNCILHQPHLHSLLSHPQCHYPENGHRPSLQHGAALGTERSCVCKKLLCFFNGSERFDATHYRGLWSKGVILQGPRLRSRSKWTQGIVDK